MMDAQTSTFEEHRAHLEGLAYRMLGSVEDARDVVQDTYLRWSEVDTDSVRDARAWLVTACSRRAMDVLRAARLRRADYIGPWLPDPAIEAAEDERAELDETVSVALLVALERLSPLERAAFLLHDVFGHTFPEVGEILGRTSAAARQLASRARTHVEAERPRFRASADEHRRLLDAFLAAARAGDVAGLRALVVDSVELHADGGGKALAAPDVVRGAEAVCRFLAKVWRDPGEGTSAVPTRFNGAPALLVLENGRPVTAIVVELAAGAGGPRVTRVFAHRNPDKLAHLAP